MKETQLLSLEEEALGEEKAEEACGVGIMSWGIFFFKVLTPSLCCVKRFFKMAGGPSRWGVMNGTQQLLRTWERGSLEVEGAQQDRELGL